MEGKHMAEEFLYDAALWRKLEEGSMPEPNSGCLLWLGKVDRDGYGRVRSAPRRETMFKIHRVAFQVHRGIIPKGMSVCHHCDVPSCINPEHLFLGTHADNMADMHAKGRALKGERHPLSKLTADQVRTIRADKSHGPTKLAAALGVYRATVQDVIARRTWRHI